MVDGRVGGWIAYGWMDDGWVDDWPVVVVMQMKMHRKLQERYFLNFYILINYLLLFCKF